MPLILKLVGCSNDRKYYEINNLFVETINLKLLMDLFIGKGIELEEFASIKIITKGEQITDLYKEYIINDTQTFYIFSQNQVIRKKLLDIFIEYGTVINTQQIKEEESENEKEYDTAKEDETVEAEESENEEQEELTPEIIDIMNKKTIDLFADNDFKNLLNIYMKKPELFSTFAQYVRSGNIIDEFVVNEKKEEYDELVKKLVELNLNISEEVLMEKLIKYKGHLNLTLRAILTETI